jgi:uncharacterized repeat protein (TIGR01451 family)
MATPVSSLTLGMSSSPSSLTTLHPDDTIAYSATITNTGSSSASNVSFNDTPDGNSTLVPGSVHTTPIAVPDSYSAYGNMPLNVPAVSGVLSNDVDPADGTAGLSVTTIGSISTVQGGTASMNADGSFTYRPPAGYDGSDSFNYTISDGTSTSTATVTFVISGMIWFIDSSKSNGNGTMQSPFNSLTAFNGINNAGTNHAKSGDLIFLYSSASAYTGTVVLQNSQLLIGQGATATLSSILGATPPSFSANFPQTHADNSTLADPTDTSTIALGSGNSVRGLNINTTSSAAALSGNSFGTLSLGDIASISNTGGPALSLSTGTISPTTAISTGVTVGTLSSVGSGTVGLQLIGVGGSFRAGSLTASTSINTAVSLASNTASVTLDSVSLTPNSGAAGISATNNTAGTLTIGAGTVTSTNSNAVVITGPSSSSLTPISVSLTKVTDSGTYTNGIDVENTSGAFTVTGSGGTCNSSTPCTGGSISNSSEAGAYFHDAGTVSLNFMFFTGTGQGVATNSYCVLYVDDIASTPNFTLTHSELDSGKSDCVSAQSANTSALTLNTTIQTNAFNGDAGSDIVLLSRDNATQTFNVSSNVMEGSQVTAIQVDDQTTTGSPTISGTIDSNIIGCATTTTSSVCGSATPFHSASAGGNGIRVHVEAPTGTATVKVSNNHVYSVGGPAGLDFEAGKASSSALVLNLTATNNTFVVDDSNSNEAGILGESGIAPTDPDVICFSTSGNVISNPIGGNNGVYDIGLTDDPGSTFILPGYSGPALETGGQVETYLANLNGSAPASDELAVVNAGATGFTSTSACATPTTFVATARSAKVRPAAHNSAPAPRAPEIGAETAGPRVAGAPRLVRAMGDFSSNSLSIGTLPPGSQVVITFQAAVNGHINSPAGATQIVNGGVVTATGVSPITNSASNPLVLLSTTTTVLSSSPSNTSTVGNSVTFTATVQSTFSGSVTGTVKFFDGDPSVSATQIGTDQSLDGTQHASVSTSTLSVGDHSIYAVYEGDTRYTGSQSSLVQHILTPTAVLVSRFIAHHVGTSLDFHWRVTAGVHALGFTLSAGGDVLTHGVIPAHAASAYHFNVRSNAHGPYRLHVLLDGGRTATVSTHR